MKFYKFIFSILTVLSLKYSFELCKTYYNKDIILTYGFEDDYVPYNSFDKMLLLLKKSASDKRVKGLCINYRYGILSGYTSLSNIEELNQILDLMKKNKKFVHVYSPSLDFKSLYLISHASKVTLAHNSDSYISGLHLHIPFMKDYYKSNGINVDITTTGEFKTGENEIRSSMSDEYREGLAQLLKSTSQIITNDIQKSINMNNIESIMGFKTNIEIADKAKFFTIDSFINWKNQYQNKVSISQYAKQYKAIENNSKIVILNIIGPIMSNSSFCSMSFLNELDKIGKDKKVKAVILRIDSPGGCSYHSSELYSALKNLRKKKTLLSSVKGTATSGSYMIALAGERIFTSNSAFIGSIGVIGTHTHSKKHGINFESIHSHMEDVNEFNPLTKLQKENYINSVKRSLQQFRNLVQIERNFDPKYAKQISLGQVYTGEESIKLGLVDEKGGLLDVIKHISMHKNLNNPQIVFYN